MAANLPRPDSSGKASKARDGEKRRLVLEMLSSGLTAADPISRRRFRIRGHCMVPLVREGDVVTAEPLAGSPRLGDLLIARVGSEEIVCHRALEIAVAGLGLAGDASHRLDRVPPAAVLGRVVRVERGGVSLDWQTPAWRALAPLLARWHVLARRFRVRRGRRPIFLAIEYPRRAALRLLACRWWTAR
ncbi:MAG: S24/S26 family peptidase [Acidobacteriota bacterium]